MNFTTVSRTKDLTEEHYGFLLKKVKKDLSLIEVKPFMDSKNLIALGPLIVGELEDQSVTLYLKYRKAPVDLVSYIESKALNKDYDLVKKEKTDERLRLEANYGELSRLSGKSFEESFIEDLKRKGPYYQLIIGKILTDRKINIPLETVNVLVEGVGSNLYETLAGYKSPSKADVVLKIKSQNIEEFKVGISLKKTPRRTQVSINSVDSFLDSLFLQENVSCTDRIKTTLKKFCGVEGFTPSILDPNIKLGQKDRDRYLFNELKESEQKELLEWCEKYKKEILTVVLFKGGIKDGPFADYLVIAKESYTLGDQLSEILIESKEEVLESALTCPVYPGKNFGTVNLGAGVSFQMKGSGEQRKHKTMLQFQKITK